MRQRTIDSLLVSLRAGKDKKTGEVSWSVVLEAEYDYRRRFYESVNLAGGKTLPAKNLGRTALGCSHGSCSFAEASRALLDADDMRTGLASGLKMRWNASQGGGFGSSEVEIPAAYFAAMAEAAKR